MNHQGTPDYLAANLTPMDMYDLHMKVNTSDTKINTSDTDRDMDAYSQQSKSISTSSVGRVTEQPGICTTILPPQTKFKKNLTDLMSKVKDLSFGRTVSAEPCGRTAEADIADNYFSVDNSIAAYSSCATSAGLIAYSTECGVSDLLTTYDAANESREMYMENDIASVTTAICSIDDGPASESIAVYSADGIYLGDLVRTMTDFAGVATTLCSDEFAQEYPNQYISAASEPADFFTDPTLYRSVLLPFACNAGSELLVSSDDIKSDVTRSGNCDNSTAQSGVLPTVTESKSASSAAKSKPKRIKHDKYRVLFTIKERSSYIYKNGQFNACTMTDNDALLTDTIDVYVPKRCIDELECVGRESLVLWKMSAADVDELKTQVSNEVKRKRLDCFDILKKSSYSDDVFVDGYVTLQDMMRSKPPNKCELNTTKQDRNLICDDNSDAMNISMVQDARESNNNFTAGRVLSLLVEADTRKTFSTQRHSSCGTAADDDAVESRDGSNVSVSLETSSVRLVSSVTNSDVRKNGYNLSVSKKRKKSGLTAFSVSDSSKHLPVVNFGNDYRESPFVNICRNCKVELCVNLDRDCRVKSLTNSSCASDVKSCVGENQTVDSNADTVCGDENKVPSSFHRFSGDCNEKANDNEQQPRLTCYSSDQVLLNCSRANVENNDKLSHTVASRPTGARPVRECKMGCLFCVCGLDDDTASVSTSQEIPTRSTSSISSLSLPLAEPLVNKATAMTKTTFKRHKLNIFEQWSQRTDASLSEENLLVSEIDTTAERHNLTQDFDVSDSGRSIWSSVKLSGEKSESDKLPVSLQCNEIKTAKYHCDDVKLQRRCFVGLTHIDYCQVLDSRFSSVIGSDENSSSSSSSSSTILQGILLNEQDEISINGDSKSLQGIENVTQNSMQNTNRRGKSTESKKKRRVETNDNGTGDLHESVTDARLLDLADIEKKHSDSSISTCGPVVETLNGQLMMTQNLIITQVEQKRSVSPFAEEEIQTKNYNEPAVVENNNRSSKRARSEVVQRSQANTTFSQRKHTHRESTNSVRQASAKEVGGRRKTYLKASIKDHEPKIQNDAAINNVDRLTTTSNKDTASSLSESTRNKQEHISSSGASSAAIDEAAARLLAKKKRERLIEIERQRLIAELAFLTVPPQSSPVTNEKMTKQLVTNSLSSASVKSAGNNRSCFDVFQTNSSLSSQSMMNSVIDLKETADQHVPYSSCLVDTNIVDMDSTLRRYADCNSNNCAQADCSLSSLQCSVEKRRENIFDLLITTDSREIFRP